MVNNGTNIYITNNHLNSLNTKTKTKKHDHNIGNPVPSLGQSQTFGCVNTVKIMIKLEKPRLP